MQTIQKAVKEKIIKPKRQSRQKMQDFLTAEYERASQTYAEGEASKIINSAAERAVIQPGYNEIITDVWNVVDASTKINSAAQAKIQRNRYVKVIERVRKHNKLQNTQYNLIIWLQLWINNRKQINYLI